MSARRRILLVFVQFIDFAGRVVAPRQPRGLSSQSCCHSRKERDKKRRGIPRIDAAPRPPARLDAPGHFFASHDHKTSLISINATLTPCPCTVASSRGP